MSIESESPSDVVGPRLRKAREEKGMSLRALAAAIGVSPSLISQVETGKTRPSVSTLYAMVSHLGISTDALLGRTDESAAPVAQLAPPEQAFTPPPGKYFHLQRSDENPTLDMQNGVKWERLSVLPNTDVEALRVTYQPGGSSSIEGHLMRHFGIEHVYLISGELKIQIEFETHVIRGGDSMVFDSQRPHLFVNESNAPAIGVWYITGREAATRELESAGGMRVESNDPPTSPTSALDVLRQFRA